MKIKKIELVIKPFVDTENPKAGWQAIRKDDGRQAYACYKENCTEIDEKLSITLRNHVEKYVVTRRGEENESYTLMSYANE